MRTWLRRWLAGTAVVVGWASCAAWVQAQAPAERPPEEPLVAIRRGASLEEALGALQRAIGKPVLAEVPSVRRMLEAELRAGVPAALQRISESFHLRSVWRPGSLVFQRRYVDAKEWPDLEIEEMAAVAADVYRLIRGASSSPADITAITNNRDFIDSLSPVQVQAMREKEGMSIDGLTPQQRALWMRILNTYGYGSEAMECRRANQLFSTWKRGELLHRASRYALLSHRCPDPESSGGWLVRNFNWGVGSFPPAPVSLSVAQLPERPLRLPARFNRPARIRSGKVPLTEVISALESASGSRIRIAAHAQGRQLLAFADRSPARQVVVALEDLYGWELEHQRDNRYLLRRPPAAPARDAIDLHQKLRAALPPAIHLLWADETALVSSLRRYNDQLKFVLDRAAALKGPDWKQLAVAELDAEAQQVLASFLFDRYLYGELNGVIRREQPWWWLVEPEKGYLTLDGDLGPGRHPLLLFNVRRPDRKIDQVGWAVGTSSLYSK